MGYTSAARSVAVCRGRLRRALTALYPHFSLRQGALRPSSVISMCYCLSITAIGVYMALPFTLFPLWTSHPFGVSVLIALYLWCLFNMLISYFLTAVTDPGRVPSSWRPVGFQLEMPSRPNTPYSSPKKKRKSKQQQQQQQHQNLQDRPQSVPLPPPTSTSTSATTAITTKRHHTPSTMPSLAFAPVSALTSVPAPSSLPSPSPSPSPSSSPPPPPLRPPPPTTTTTVAIESHAVAIPFSSPVSADTGKSTEKPNQQHHETDPSIINAACSTSSGDDDDMDKEPVMYPVAPKEVYQAGTAMRRLDGRFRFCTTCDVFKPDRSHHCSQCQACILVMDHHCPFTGNGCIGLYNRKYFVLFLYYAFFTAFFSGIVSLPNAVYYIMLRDFALSTGYAHLDMLNSLHPLAPLGTIVMIASFNLICLFHACVLGPFAVYHSFLVLKNRTTVERMGHEFNRMHSEELKRLDRSLFQHWCAVFGWPPWTWFVPVGCGRDLDGIRWHRQHSNAANASRDEIQIQTLVVSTSHATSSTSVPVRGDSLV